MHIRLSRHQATAGLLALLIGFAAATGCGGVSGDDPIDDSAGMGGEDEAGGLGGDGGGMGGEAGSAGEGGGGGTAGNAGGKGGKGGSGPPPIRAAYGIDSLPPNTTCIAVERATDPLPSKLSDTGCVSKQDPREPAPGVLPYDVASPLWSDGASKRRFLALPPNGKITVLADGDRKGDWDLPVGTTLIKTFELDGQMLETRFFVRLKDGAWFGYTYQWPPNGTDAVLLGPDSAARNVGDVRWTIPSRANCLACHTEGAGRSLGLETAQLNSDFVYSGNKVANQLATLDHLSLFTKPIGDPAKLPALPNPLGSSATKEERARSYLHANCSHCHRPGGVKDVTMDFRYAVPFAQTKTCNKLPSKNAYSIPGAMLIAPGSAEQSIISFRVNNLIPEIRMPAIGTAVVDTDGVALIDTWISELAACPE